MKYISLDPMTDRDQLKRGNKLTPATPAEIRVKKLVFRNLFIEERDAEIARVLWNYFTAVAQRWPNAWGPKTAGMILNRTTGYRALMRFLPIAYLSLGMDTVIPTAEFKVLFDRVKLEDDDFTPDNFKPGTSGQTLLYKEILLASKLDEEFPGRVQARSSDHGR